MVGLSPYNTSTRDSYMQALGPHKQQTTSDFNYALAQLPWAGSNRPFVLGVAVQAGKVIVVSPRPVSTWR